MAAREAVAEGFGKLASHSRTKKIHWLWKGRLPLGMLGALDGDPDLGKSQLLALFAAHVTTGRDWPDGSPCPQGGAIIVGAEDPEEEVAVPRLIAAGADLGKVLRIETVTLPDDIDRLEQAMREMDARFIGFDPIFTCFPPRLNPDRDSDMRKFLTPLAQMLARTKASGLMLRHLSKNDQRANALYRALHSVAGSAVARVVLAVAKDRDTDERLLTMSKCNVGLKAPSLLYEIQEVTLPGEVITSRIVLGAESARTADSLMLAGDVTSKLETAKSFLFRALAAGETAEEDIKLAAEHEGISRATLWRARGAVGVQSSKRGFNPGRWYWCLPAAKHVKPTEASQAEVPPKSLKEAASQAEIEYEMRSVSGREIETLRSTETLEPSQISARDTSPNGAQDWPDDGDLLSLAAVGPPPDEVLAE